MPISFRHVEEALRLLGGEAQIGEILRKVLEIAPPPHPKRAREVVRGRLYQYSSQTSSYKEGTPDLFETVDGLAARPGRWRLRSSPLAAVDSDTVLEQTEADIEAAEGRRRLRMHLGRERSATLIKAFKARLSNFACEACGDDMEAIYGELGRGYVEAHHKVPVALIEEGSTTKLSDLAALCANCHRMIHRNGLMSVEALAAHLKALQTPRAAAAEHPQAGWIHNAPETED